jgi:hypothetical protein
MVVITYFEIKIKCLTFIERFSLMFFCVKMLCSEELFVIINYSQLNLT